MTAPRLLGAVLAGGRSTRLGRDKAAETVGGVRMIDRATVLLRPHCTEVVVVSSRSDTPTGGARRVADLRPPCGPLGGIESALHSATEGGCDAAIVVAVDLPLLAGDGVARLIEAFEELCPEGAAGRPLAVAASRGADHLEPLCAIYSAGCLPVATRLLDEGDRAARALFAAVDGCRVEGVADTATNVNDAAALAAARARVGRAALGRSDAAR